MRAARFDQAAILERYPEQKPICFNYFTARSDVLTLLAEKEQLEKRLIELENKKVSDVK